MQHRFSVVVCAPSCIPLSLVDPRAGSPSQRPPASFHSQALLLLFAS